MSSSTDEKEEREPFRHVNVLWAPVALQPWHGAAQQLRALLLDSDYTASPQQKSRLFTIYQQNPFLHELASVTFGPVHSSKHTLSIQYVHKLCTRPTKALRFVCSANVCVLCVRASECTDDLLKGRFLRLFTRTVSELHVAGINSLVVVVCDTETGLWAETTWTQLEETLNQRCQRADIKDHCVLATDVQGVPVTPDADEFVPAERGLGEILHAIDTRKRVSSQLYRRLARPLLMCVQDVFEVSGCGTVLICGIAQGSLRRGSQLGLVPAELMATVDSIHFFGKDVEEATVGMQVGVRLEGLRRDDVKRGMMLVDPHAEEPMQLCTRMRCMLLTFSMPGWRGAGPGLKPIATLGGNRTEVRLDKLLQLMDVQTQKVTESNPERIPRYRSLSMCEFSTVRNALIAWPMDNSNHTPVTSHINLYISEELFGLMRCEEVLESSPPQWKSAAWAPETHQRYSKPLRDAVFTLLCINTHAFSIETHEEGCEDEEMSENDSDDPFHSSTWKQLPQEVLFRVFMHTAVLWR